MTEEPGTSSEPTSSEPPETGDPPDLDEGGLSRRKFIGSVAAAGIGGLTLAGVLAACGGGSTDETTATTAAATTEASTTTPAGQTSANNGQPIVIGSAYPAVNAPTDAEQMVGGSGLAIAEINAAGGVAGRPIEHEIVDMNSFDAASVTAGFNDIVSKEVDAIIFGYHNVFEPNDIAAAYGAPFLNASTSITQVDGR